MARAKTSTQKSRTRSDHDRYTAELSAGQLVIGMSILLMICLASFLMGVVVGKFDPSLNPEAALESPPIQEVAAVPSASTQAVMPTRKPPPPELRTPRTTVKAQAAGGEEKSKPEEPVVAPVKSEPAESEPKVKVDKPPEPAREPVKVAQTDVADVAGRPSAKSVQPQVTTIVRTRYGVQVAAFTTRKRAEVVKQDLETRTAYKGGIVLSKSGRLFKVVVGSYAEYQSASTVRDDLKLHFGFGDCFVTSLQ